MHAVDSVQLSAPEVVTGAYGASVTVSCQYDLQFKEYTKYWCKGQLYELCSIVVATPKGQQSDRSSIADDKDAGVFTVTMTSLKESDQEMYWCVIARPGRNVYTGVRLRVSHTGMLQLIWPTHERETSWLSNEQSGSWSRPHPHPPSCPPPSLLLNSYRHRKGTS
uniref:Immunoglobulin domain-containing protein n=1 Tax=Sander lucioperca TaxID=283035 RepID=A0A8D0DB74_SANLU